MQRSGRGCAQQVVIEGAVRVALCRPAHALRKERSATASAARARSNRARQGICMRNPNAILGKRTQRRTPPAGGWKRA
jgi:hypothetical protein